MYICPFFKKCMSKLINDSWLTFKSKVFLMWLLHNFLNFPNEVDVKSPGQFLPMEKLDKPGLPEWHHSETWALIIRNFKTKPTFQEIVQENKSEWDLCVRSSWNNRVLFSLSTYNCIYKTLKISCYTASKYLEEHP